MISNHFTTAMSHTNVQVRIAKVRNAIPTRMPVLLSGLRRLDNAVLGALDGVVGPARQQVRGVDDNGVFDGRRVDEVAVWREDLKAAGHVLEEEGYGAWSVKVVRVGLWEEVVKVGVWVYRSRCGRLRGRGARFV